MEYLSHVLPGTLHRTLAYPEQHSKSTIDDFVALPSPTKWDFVAHGASRFDAVIVRAHRYPRPPSSPPDKAKTFVKIYL